MKIEHDSSVPLYVQIKNYIRQNIHTGDYPVNSRVPSERELAKQFNVSRLTVTKALKELELEGLVYAQVGKGTYVTPLSKIDQNLETLTSFTEEMQAQKKQASSRVIYMGVDPATGVVAKALQINVNTEVFNLKRVRLADNQPLALEHSHIVYALCPGILENHDFSCESLYQVLKEVYSLRLTSAHQTVEARLATEYEAKMLDITVNAPVLSFNRVTLNDLNQPIEFVQSAYPGERYKLHSILKPNAG